jgi:phytoene dehydrogenase-like protein
MTEDYDVIVAGGGIAGLASAAFLCRQGYKTLLCEKGADVGGLVKTFYHRGFAFDAGIRAFENSGILLPMIKSLGLKLQFVPNTVSIGIGNAWTRFNRRDGLGSYCTMLAALFPDNGPDIRLIEDEIRKVIGYMDVLYGIDNPLFMEKPEPEYLLKTLLPWLLKYHVNIRKAGRLDEPVRAYLRRFTENEALIDMLVQHFFDETPTFFALSYFGQYNDYSYTQGGTGALPEALARYITERGGRIMTQTAVTGIDAQNHTSATAQGKTFRYKKLVWAADQKQLYRALKPGQNNNAEKQRALVRRSRGCNSVLSVFMGIGLEPPRFADKFGPHAFYTPSAEGLSALPDWREAAAQGEERLLVWVSSYLERTTFEISCPALQDPALAPGGKTGVTASTLMDIDLVRRFSQNGSYETFKRLCAEKITGILDSVIPGLADKTEFSLCATPLTIERETGNTDGAITGWAFTNTPIPAENRFKKITRSVLTPMADIYQCGQWSFSPSGVPVSVLTGKLAADAVHRDLRKGS